MFGKVLFMTEAKSPKKMRKRIAAGDALVEAAWLYYNDGRTQTEIAERLGVSRATVVGYLQEARANGLVRISLSEKTFLGHRLALALKERFGLKDAFVAPDDITEAATLKRVAAGAALWLPALLSPQDRLGVAWGQTLYEVAETLDADAIEDLTILQLVGSMETPYGFTAEICSALLAERLGARCVNLHAPAVVSTPEVAEILRREPVIRAQLDALGGCNKAIFAAGSAQADSHIVRSGLATTSELADYRAKGAVGVLCGRFIDAMGKPVHGELGQRIIGATLDKLMGLELGLLVSSGPDKVAPMLGVLKGGYATHMVTSQSTAASLLEAPET